MATADARDTGGGCGVGALKEEKTMKRIAAEQVAAIYSLAKAFGMTVATAGVSRSGSVYAVLVRPWIEHDTGCRVRLSDHLPGSGRVNGWADFRTTPRGLAHLYRYLAAKACRGRQAIDSATGGVKGVEGAGRGAHGVSLLARAGDAASTQQDRARAKPCDARLRTLPRGGAVVASSISH